MTQEIFGNTDSNSEKGEKKYPKSWKVFKGVFFDRKIKGLRQKRSKDIKEMVHGNRFGAVGRRVAILHSQGEEKLQEVEAYEKKIREKYKRAHKIFLELIEARGVKIEWSPWGAVTVLGEYHPKENTITLFSEIGTENRRVKENLQVLVHEFAHALDHETRGINVEDEAHNELIATAVSYLFLSKLFKKDGFYSPFFDVKYAKKSGATEDDLKELEQYILEQYEKLNTLYLSIEAEYDE